VARIVLERGDAGDDLRRILDWLEDEDVSGSGPAECVPAMDVFETASGLEIIADVPGVRADSIRVVYAQGGVAIAGQKVPRSCEHRDVAFHLAERAFGRFARGIRLSGAFDAGRARATLTTGELHIVLPRIEERRGRQIRIPITTP
jgi:HSP20 family protein